LLFHIFPFLNLKKAKIPKEHEYKKAISYIRKAEAECGRENL
jgi:hypothetical protein